MAFRYTLQPILSLRQSLERQEEQKLFAIAAIVARLRAELADLDSEHLKQKDATLRGLTQVSAGALLQFMAVCEIAVEGKRRRLEAQLREAERQRSEQLAEYQKARQKREILEGLRERQRFAYDLDLARREQQRTDEAFLIRSFLNANE
jgi:flagellar export protein FliJ